MRFPGLGSYNLTDKAIVQDRKNNANRFRIVGVKKDFWSAPIIQFIGDYKN